jgi:streptogramin lyase
MTGRVSRVVPRRLVGIVFLLAFFSLVTSASAVDVYEYPLPAGSRPYNLTTGPEGDLWITDAGLDAIDRMSTIGQVTGVFSLGMPEGALPWEIVLGPEHDLWFTMLEHDALGRITPTGEITEVPVAAPTAGITVGPDGKLWFTEVKTKAIFTIDPATLAISSFAIPTTPWDVAAGGDGNIWYSEGEDDTIGRLSISGATATEYPQLPSSSCSIFTSELACPLIERLAVGPEGNVWFTELEGKDIGRVSVGEPVSIAEFGNGLTDSAEVRDLTAGPEGNMWFTEEAANQIGWITPSGVISENSALSIGAAPFGIAAGSDGNIWFTEPGVDRIGRAIPNVPPVVATLAASAVTTTTAEIHGTVRPRGSLTSVVFQFGRSGYEVTTPSASAGEDDETIEFHNDLSSLQPGTTYHVRFVASNPYGTGLGSDVTFTTATEPPHPPPPPSETVGVFKIAFGGHRARHGQLFVSHIYISRVLPDDRVAFSCRQCVGRPKRGSRLATSSNVTFKTRGLRLSGHASITVTVTDALGDRRVRSYRVHPRHPAEEVTVAHEACYIHASTLIACH